MRVEDFAQRADQLLEIADGVLRTQFKANHYTFVEAGVFAGFRSAALSFLLNVFGPDHPYYKDFNERTKEYYFNSARGGREIIAAAKAEVIGGWNQRVRTLISAEIFSDFLDMATYLLNEGYKDAAAVMIGSVLEEHLRQLCRKNDIATELLKDNKLVPKKADMLNADLANAGVYNKLDQKAVTTWLDLRNKSAHGLYDQYTQQQVELMHQGICDFMARVAP